MSNLLWGPSEERIEKSNLFEFRKNLKVDLPDLTYTALQRWSVDHSGEFWQAVFDNAKFILHEKPKATRKGQGLRDSEWFPGTTLNFAENLLKKNDDSRALIFANERGFRKEWSFKELRAEVGRVQQGLKSLGVSKGDRVVGYLPNMAEAVIAMLAATSLGAVWSSCSPDFGIQGVLDRFGQIEPKVLFFADQYSYNGKFFSCLEKVKAISAALPNLLALVQISFPEGELESEDLGAQNFESFGSQGEPEFVAVEFNHPLYIMYSSGTTGKPKCIVHGVGGTLLAHEKELKLNSDVKEGDVLFYFTTCGWMMWNWLVSGLAQGASVVVFEGQPMYPDASALFSLAEELGITQFGTSPKFISSVMKAGYVPNENFKLEKLRTIFSTGSPLLPEHMDFVYSCIKKDVQLASICGGTDIIGCFMLGNPFDPVSRGEIQGLALGMDVQSFNEAGESVISEKADLVCTASFPNMPLYFWNDKDGKKYHEAYFDSYENVWTHGDYIEITAKGSVVVYGRSDSTLNPGGVRIGTAEIYRLVEAFDWVKDSIVVGRPKEGDIEICLFVVISGDLSKQRIGEIKTSIQRAASPRHVPSLIGKVSEIPRTLSGKKVEKAVLNTLNSEEVSNLMALSNPSSLQDFEVFRQ